MRKIIITILVITVALICWRLGHQKTADKNFGVPAIKNTALHYSYFSQKSFFDDAYARAKSQAYQGSARGIIVNHHLLAAHLIAQTFAAIATDAPTTVLLVSPNHFSAGNGDVIVSAAPWNTPYGILKPNTSVIQELANKNLAQIEESPFEKEHGISGIVPFIKKSLPNATVIPIIFRDRMTITQAVAVADRYELSLPKNIIVVGSFDFSHYLTHRAADFHDIKNIEAIENFDFESLHSLDIDSKPGLAFMLELLKDMGDQQFHLVAHSNSAAIAQKEDTLETTSYSNGYFMPGAPATGTIKTMLSFGNIIPSRDVYDVLQRYNKAFGVEYLERLFTGQDTTSISVYNDNENGIAHDIETELKSFWFTIRTTNTTTVGSATIYYVHFSSPLFSQQQEQARGLINSGAVDIVIGDGPYNSPIELYKGRLIFYGQGTFLSAALIKSKGTSVALGFSQTGESISVAILPIAIKDGKGQLLVGTGDDIVLLELSKKAIGPKTFQEEIKKGTIYIDNLL